MTAADYNTADVFLVILIGVGSAEIGDRLRRSDSRDDDRQKRRVAVKTSVVAAVIAALLLLFGDIAQHVFHFSHASLAIAGGIVMFLLGIDMALGKSGDRPRSDVVNDPNEIAVTPLALPLTLNPVGVVALITYSVQLRWTQEAQTELMIAGGGGDQRVYVPGGRPLQGDTRGHDHGDRDHLRASCCARSPCSWC